MPNKKKPRPSSHSDGATEEFLTATDSLPCDPRADAWWWHCAHRALITLARTGQPFDAYQLTLMGVPDPDIPQRWGVLFMAAQRAGIIRSLGFVRSNRPTRHAGVCQLWEGVPDVDECAA